MSKRRNLLFAVLATLFCTIFAFACAPKKAPKPDDPPPGPGTVTPEVTYTVTFDANGGAFADGSEQQKVTGVKSGATVTAPEVSREDYDFTGWHTDSEATTKVDLSVYAVKADVTLYAGWEEEGGTPTPPPAQATLESISVTPPTKTSYIQGQSIDLTGFKVTAKYSDNSEKQVAASDCTFSPELDAVTATPGNDKVITVTYEGKTDTFKINVAAKVVTELKIEGSLNKFNYNIGEQFNPDGLVFKATYNDDTTQTIPAAQITFTSENPAFSANKTFTSAGSVEITASYGGVSATDKISVTVVERFTVTFSSNVMELGLSSSLVENMPNVIPDVEKNSKINAPSAQPTLKAYTFGGWYKETACINEWNFATDVVDGAVTTLYAKWTAVGAFNITYHNIDGATNPNPATYTPTSNKYATLTLQNAQKEHYNFDGWYTAATGGAKKTSLTYTDLPTNQATAINLYARFTPKTYSITFDLNSHELPITIVKDSSTRWNTTYTYGTSVALPTADNMTITKNGGTGDTNNYSFAGWKIREQGGTLTDINGEYLTKDKGTGDVTLVPDISTVALVPFTYDFNYDVTPRTETVNIREGQPASTSKIADPTRLGYTFDGWYDNPQGTGSKYDFAGTTIASGNTYIVYAKWTENSYIISYNLSELSGAHTTNTTSYKITDREVTLSDPTNLTTGYYFLGWFTEAGGSGDRVTALNPTLIEGKANGGTVTLYAHFDNKYTVMFDAQGGSPTPSQKTLAYGSTVADVADPTRANYTFDGWYTGATDGVKWVFGVGGSTVPAQNITLYARWIENADDGWYIVPVGTKLTKANAADYVMTNSARSDVSLGLNSEFEVFSYTKANGSKQYRAVTPTVKPAGAMTVTLTGNVYKATVYNAGNSATWDVKVTTGLEITMHGYFDTRKPDGTKQGLTPANAVNDTAYVAGNFTGASSAITSEWANATAIGGKFYWQNVSLEQYDRLHVRYNGNDTADIDVTNTGNYNIVFDPTQNTVTLYAVSEQTLTVSVDGSKIFVGDTAAVIREKRISAITVKLGDSPLSGGYELVLSDAVAGANASKVIAIYQGTVVEKTYTATAVAESGVAIEFESDAKSYYWGDTPQAGDYIVTVLYNNGSSQGITTGFTLTLSGAGSTSNLFASAKGSVGVSYKTFNASIEVDVFNKVTSVAVAVKDGGLSFVEGTEFKLASGDITVTVTFNDDSQKQTTIGSDKYTLNPAVDTTLALGTSSVTLTYNGYGNAHTTFPITVTEKQVTSISVNATAANVKKDYTYGEALVKTGLVVTATYNNNTTRPLGEGEYTLELIVDTAGGATNPFAPITGSIKVKYSDTITDEYQITYHNKVTSLQINKKQGVAFEYIEGTSFTLNDGDITVTAYFNNTTSLNATLTSEQYTLSPAVGDKLDTVGTQTITVTCNNTTVTATFDVTVNAKSLTEISVENTNALVKKAYKVGEAFAPADLTLKRSYNNGTSDFVALSGLSGVTFADDSNNETYYKNGIFIKAGSFKLKVNYNGQTATINVTLTVEDVLSKIAVTERPTLPRAIGYVEGDLFSHNGLEVTATYNEGVTDGEYTAVVTRDCEVSIAADTALTKGSHTVTVTFSGKTAQFTINVVARVVTKLTYTGTVAKQHVGKYFNAAGLSFEVTYNNGEVESIDAGSITFTGALSIYDPSSGGFMKTGENITITASYGGQNVDITGVSVDYVTFRKVEYVYTNGDYDVTGPNYDEVEHGTAVGQAPTPPTSKGFRFVGWYEDEHFGGEQYDFTSVVTKDIKLYGKWEPITYTLTLTDLDGKTVEFTPSTTDMDYSVSLDDATAASGYRFKGWTFVGNDGNPVKTFTYALLLKATVGDNNTIALTAVFEQIHNVTITFNLNYDGAPTAQTKEVEQGSTLTEGDLTAYEPSRAGWTFDGWYEDKDGNTMWNYGSPIDDDIEVYAKWTRITHTVTFNANKPSGVTNNVTGLPSPTTQSYGEGDKINKPADPSLIAHEFGGWYQDAACTEAKKWNFDTDTVGTANINLYAKWTAVNGIYVNNVLYKASVVQNANEDAVKAVKLGVDATNTNFTWYRNGNAVNNMPIKNETDKFSVVGTTITAKKAYYYDLTYQYQNGDLGLWVKVLGGVNTYVEPNIQPTDGVYINGVKATKNGDFVINPNDFNGVMAEGVVVGSGTGTTTYSITFRYGGSTTPATIAAIASGSGSGFNQVSSVTISNNTITLYAGTYNFYYTYSKTDEYVTGRTWVNGTQTGGPADKNSGQTWDKVVSGSGWVVGQFKERSMGSFDWDNGYKMTLSGSEYQIKRLYLTADDTFKIRAGDYYSSGCAWVRGATGVGEFDYTNSSIHKSLLTYLNFDGNSNIKVVKSGYYSFYVSNTKNIWFEYSET